MLRRWKATPLIGGFSCAGCLSTVTLCLFPFSPGQFGEAPEADVRADPAGAELPREEPPLALVQPPVCRQRERVGLLLGRRGETLPPSPLPSSLVLSYSSFSCLSSSSSLLFIPPFPSFLFFHPSLSSLLIFHSFFPSLLPFPFSFFC